MPSHQEALQEASLHLNKKLPVKISEYASLKQAIFWVAFKIPPMPRDYELTHKIPNRTDDNDYWPETHENIRKIELAKSKLYFKFKEGELIAQGRRAAPNGIGKFNNYDPDFPSDKPNNLHEDTDLYISKFYDTPDSQWPGFENISKVCWTLKQINWDDSAMFFSDHVLLGNVMWDLDTWGEDDTLGYGKIRINTKELMKVFPEDTIEKPKTNTKPKSNAGRDSKYKWDEIFEEIAKYIIRNPICPQYQKTLNDDMLQWCNDEYNEEPAKSRMHDKLKPIFDEWKNNSKE
tara:strand:- start:1759 stop:2628 length:870 start_codon:yes stop_codon:yes gene_type:complete